MDQVAGARRGAPWIDQLPTSRVGLDERAMGTASLAWKGVRPETNEGPGSVRGPGLNLDRAKGSHGRDHPVTTVPVD